MKKIQTKYLTSATAGFLGLMAWTGVGNAACQNGFMCVTYKPVGMTTGYSACLEDKKPQSNNVKLALRLKELQMTPTGTCSPQKTLTEADFELSNAVANYVKSADPKTFWEKYNDFVKGKISFADLNSFLGEAIQSEPHLLIIKGLIQKINPDLVALYTLIQDEILTSHKVVAEIHQKIDKDLREKHGQSPPDVLLKIRQERAAEREKTGETFWTLYQNAFKPGGTLADLKDFLNKNVTLSTKRDAIIDLLLKIHPTLTKKDFESPAVGVQK